MTNKALLSVQDLSISFGKKTKRTEVIHSISFEIPQHSIVGIVGESGSGKSVTSMAIMGLLPKKNTLLTGSISFEETQLLNEKNKV